MFEAFILVGGAIALLVVVRLFGADQRRSVREGLSATQALLALCAILLGLTWFFEARPDAPRVALALTATPYLNGYPHILLAMQAELKNNGQTAMIFGQASSIDFIGQRILPFDPASVEQQLATPPPATGAREVKALQTATIWHDRMALDNMLESGEADQVSHYVLLDCDKDRLVAVSAVLRKPLQPWERWLRDVGLGVPHAARDEQYWRARTTVDLSTICTAEERTR